MSTVYYHNLLSDEYVLVSVLYYVQHYTVAYICIYLLKIQLSMETNKQLDLLLPSTYRGGQH